MTPIEFPEQTTIIAKDQPQYRPLPALIDVEGGSIIFCWKLTFRERLRLLFTGKLWHRVLNFGSPLQPQFLTDKKSEVIL